jgi:DNA-binding SARP family transcriptional activator
MSPPLTIKLLGGFSLTYGNQPIVGMNTPRSQALLSYLLLHRDSPQPRQRLAFELWTDSTDPQARTNLRKELSYLRRDLPDADHFLVIDAKTLQWLPTAPFTLDVIEFEQAAQASEQGDRATRQSQLEQAIARYRGELLPNCADEWILPERDRLQQLYIRALERLIDQVKEQQDYRLALSYAHQLLRVDPLTESTYCTLMRLYHLNGDRANALQVYHRCRTVLSEDLGVDPSPTTRKLYEALLLEEDEPSTDILSPSATLPTAEPQRLPTRAPPQLTYPLMGREQEWQRLQQWGSDDRSDGARSVGDPRRPKSMSEVFLLIGEPGIGKTRLLEELQATVPQTLWGNGFAAEMVRPYGIWIDALRSRPIPADLPISAELGWLLPELGQPAAMPPDRSHLFDAVVQLLAAWATQVPLVVILDNIQWVDEASSALLNYASVPSKNR